MEERWSCLSPNPLVNPQRGRLEWEAQYPEHVCTWSSLLVCFGAAEHKDALTKLQGEHTMHRMTRKETQQGYQFFAILYFVTKIQVCVSIACVCLRMCVSLSFFLSCEMEKARRAAAPSDWWPARPQPLMKNARGSRWELISRSSSPCRCPPCQA